MFLDLAKGSKGCKGVKGSYAQKGRFERKILRGKLKVGVAQIALDKKGGKGPKGSKGVEGCKRIVDIITTKDY